MDGWKTSFDLFSGAMLVSGSVNFKLLGDYGNYIFFVRKKALKHFCFMVGVRGLSELVFVSILFRSR